MNVSSLISFTLHSYKIINFYPNLASSLWELTCKNNLKTTERKVSLGKDWHSGCLRCEKCNKTLTPGSHAEHDGKPYCHTPCYSALYGPGGFGRGGAESYVYKK